MSDQQLQRYSRQIMLPQFDVAGQERLLAAKVLVAGVGGLGSPVALYLAAAGVGSLVLADGDQVDASNLQRQVAHNEASIGMSKVESAAATIRALNSATELVLVAEQLQGELLREQVAAVDLVIDATDSFISRLELNQACIELARPLVSGAAIRSEGQLAVFDSKRNTPCYRCVYPQGEQEENLSCSESGVLAPIVGVIGSLQALEAIKILAGFGEPLYGQMLLLDGWSLQSRTITLRKNPDCPHCGPDRAAAGA
ncbi:MAG: molybdopterin-synthase adenylyltransferase MoeB [Halieaceae bacterium]